MSNLSAVWYFLIGQNHKYGFNFKKHLLDFGGWRFHAKPAFFINVLGGDQKNNY